MTGRTDQMIAATKAAPWVHWHFSQEDWQDWASTRLAAETSLRGWLGLPGFVVLSTVLATLVIGWSVIAAGPPDENAIVLSVLALGLSVVGLVAALRHALADRNYRRRTAAPPEIWFGPHGVVLGDRFMAFASSRQSLLGARLADPRAGSGMLLRFVISAGSAGHVKIEHLPVPPDAASDLAKLQHLLGQQCPKAKIRLAAEPR